MTEVASLIGLPRFAALCGGNSDGTYIMNRSKIRKVSRL